jgi:large subunit ribosomal protein L29
MSKAKDLRNLSLDELDASYQDLQKKLYQLVNEKEQARQYEKSHLIRDTKKDISRLLTVKTEITNSIL